MQHKLVFIYDGECPFCNKFAELLEFKSGLPNISIKDARKNLSDLAILHKKGYDIDHGAILLKDDEILHGANAINFICSQIKEPSDSLLKLLSITFASNQRSYFFFPFLLIARRTILYFKKIPIKLFD